MFIQFDNKKVERECRNLKEAQKKYGAKIANKLFKLINFIEAAENLDSLKNNPIYHFHALKGDKEGLYALDIDGRRSGYRLIVYFTEDKHIVFTDSLSIQAIIFKEVSNHYE